MATVPNDRRYLETHEWFKLDGKTVSGIINPGPDQIPMSNVALDVMNWTLRFEAEAKGASGAAQITAEGRLEDISSYHRTLRGTWQQGGVKGDFKLTRD